MSPPLPLAPEAPVLLSVDGARLTLFMCTPLCLDELGVGHLLGRGLLADRAGLRSVLVCPDRGRVQVERLGGPPVDEGSFTLLHSACGAGGSLEGALGLEGRAPLPPSAHFTLAGLAALAREMSAAAELYRETGGLHSAALASAEPGVPLVVREDVGRHNAVDKVLGRGLFDGLDRTRCAILTSGRIAADMAVKAVFAGVPVLASRSVPTTAAYEIARRFNVTLVGRVGSREPVVFCGAGRILPAASAAGAAAAEAAARA